ncbi:MAG: HD domain-containing protein [Bacteroidales bacterium]|jgi:HD superfamily phosphodiesterase|nr:HD domain-containing protein [Bacteroidales bacterium]
MNQTDNKINRAEEKWLMQLFRFCGSVFSKTNIPSHDHHHHFRVWNYCKEIIRELHFKVPVTDELVEGCIVASFFHDTGLSVTLNEYHGKESKKICQGYFRNHDLPVPENFDEILEAIEKHDNKNYPTKNFRPGSLYTILCNADDLDAFGRIGIVRYTEIYLMRGIKLHELTPLVIQNLDKRYRNFKNTYDQYQQLIQKHESRYRLTRKFFEEIQDEFI